MRRGLILVAPVLAIVAPSAMAGVYEVPACGGPVPDAPTWTGTSSAPGSLEVAAQCPAGGRVGGLIARDRIGVINTPQGARAEWVFTAPAGTRIVGLRAQRWATAVGDDGWHAYLRDGTGRDLDVCAPGPGMAVCDLGLGGAVGSPEPGALAVDGIDTDRVALGVRCDIPPGQFGSFCVNGLSSNDVTYAARDLAVRLSDPTPPQVTGLDGALRSAEGRWVAGTVTVHITGTDAASGVARVGVLAGTEPAGASAAPCVAGRAVPCPGAFTGLTSVDTTRVPDGPTQFRAYADDAGGERTASAPWSVTIDNTPPSTAVAADRAPVRVGEPFALTWQRDQGSPVVRADWRLIPTSAGNRETSGVALGADLRRIPVTVASGGAYRIRVRLTDAAGNRGTETDTALFVSPATGGTTASLTPRVLVRGGRLVAVVRVARAVKPRRYVVVVTRPGHPRRRFVRLVPRGATRLTVPLGPTSRTAGRATITWRQQASRKTTTTRLRLPDTPARPTVRGTT